MKTRDFLAQVARLVRIEGRYIREDKRSNVKGTADAAFWLTDEEKEDSLPSPEDYQIADEALAYSSDIPLDAGAFALKVQAACAKEEVSFRDCNLIGAILDMAIRATEDADFQDAYAGSVSLDKPAGFVLAMRGVRVVQMRTFMIRGYDRNIIKLATPDGNILTWWASKMPQGVQPGDILARFEGRVKGASVYQGIHETLVTRCTFVPKVA